VSALDRGNAPDGRYPDGRGEYWSLCPFHPDTHSGSFSVSERGYHCFACGAEGGLTALAQHLGLEPSPVGRIGSPPTGRSDARRSKEGRSGARRSGEPRGCTLAQYADAKRLPLGFLGTLGLSQSQWRHGSRSLPMVAMPYRDQGGQVLAVRRRVALTEEEGIGRFRWRRGDRVMLYGLWRLQEMRAQGWVLIVEGESDAQTCWYHGLPALGVPGAATWKPSWAAALDGLEVCVWREPDRGGEALVAALGTTLSAFHELRPPEGLKDISQAHCQGMDVVALVARLRETARSGGGGGGDPAEEPSDRLESLAPWVRAVLDRERGRRARVQLADGLAHWLLRHKRLLVDLGSERAYLVDDRRAIWPLDRDTVSVRKALYAAGLNMTEPVTHYVLEALTMEALRRGEPVRLSRWQVARDGRVYVSCGPRSLVRATPPVGGTAPPDPPGRHGPHIECLPNGHDGVWFASDACYPEWSPTAAVSPLSVAAFVPNVRPPADVPTYTAARQRLLVGVWFAALLADVRPMPGLIAYGDKGGGKTMLLRACSRALLGPTASPTVLTDDRRDLWAMMTTLPLVCLDNLDSGAPRWFADALAAAMTGIDIETRALYTDGRRLSRPVTAVVGISTRTASFCRPDVAERLLPVTTGEFGAGERRSDQALLEQVDAQRDGLLSWGVATAARLLALVGAAPRDLPLRFIDYARLVWAAERLDLWGEGASRPRAGGGAREVEATLRALGRAQAMLAGESNPLVEAIVHAFPTLAPKGYWRGTATDLVRALAPITPGGMAGFGSGRHVAHQLREARDALAVAGLQLREVPSGRNTRFVLARPH